VRVDFRFLLIEWVLGTELLVKGSPQGTQLSTMSHFDPWNESGDRLEEVLSFPVGCVLPDCPGKNWPDRFPKPV
jgi:hypothetical protein